MMLIKNAARGDSAACDNLHQVLAVIFELDGLAAELGQQDGLSGLLSGRRVEKNREVGVRQKSTAGWICLDFFNFIDGKLFGPTIAEGALLIFCSYSGGGGGYQTNLDGNRDEVALDAAARTDSDNLGLQSNEGHSNKV